MIHLRSVIAGGIAGMVALGGGLLALPATAGPGTPAPAATTSTSATPAPTPADGPTVSWAWLRAWLVRLTPEQHRCLAEIDLPRPTDPTPQQLQQWRRQAVAAAEECGVTVSARPVRTALLRWWASLTPNQRTCLKQAGLTRPLGPLTPAERQKVLAAVKAAAQQCGVTLPPK